MTNGKTIPTFVLRTNPSIPDMYSAIYIRRPIHMFVLERVPVLE